MCVCVYTHVSNNNSYKINIMNLEESKDEYMEECGRRKEREGEMCNYIVISKNKRNNNKKECVRKIVRAQGMPSGTRNMVRGQRSPVKRGDVLPLCKGSHHEGHQGSGPI